MNTDTIAAIASGVTNTGISIIRISGEESLNILEKVFITKNKNKNIKEVKSHTIHYGYIADEGNIIDEVLVLIMKKPHSYTTEDVVEIDCHGGIIVTSRILDIIIKYGARPAEPGEFTKRAFLNGRIDLSQAEAVMEVIQAKNENALQSSILQLKGSVKEKIKEIRDIILHDVAYIEAALDDPEHIEFDSYSDTLCQRVENGRKEIKKLIESSQNGKFVKEGIRTVIIGKPNAGKSSLMNLFAGEDRAIVTSIAGTTRDTLEETIQMDGITLSLVDTAGIRDTTDLVEKIGVEKAKKLLKAADLIIYIVDGSTYFDKNDEAILKLIEDRKTLILLNKIDLDLLTTKEFLKVKTSKDIIPVSVKGNDGIDTLKEKIKELFFHGEINLNDEIYITNVRHKKALMDALESLDRVKKSIFEGMPEDFLSIDLMAAYEELGTITGDTASEDLVNMIFQEFCMGK